MVLKTVETTVTVDVDLEEFETDELQDELEYRGLTVQSKDEADSLEDCIRNLHSDFINWYQFGMSNENFENTLKQFFKDTIGVYEV